MEQVVRPARKVVGEVRVPGEVGAAAQAVVLAALAEGEGRVLNAPPAVDGLIAVLGRLGVTAERHGREVVVVGKGLRGFEPPTEPLDPGPAGEAGLLLVALLAGQSFATRLAPLPAPERLSPLLGYLTAMGAAVDQVDGILTVGDGPGLRGAAHETVDLEADLKLAVLVAGLYADGVTTLRETLGNRTRSERLLRERQVVVERHRQDDADQYLVSIAGGQPMATTVAEIAGDLTLAGPLLIPALALKGSTVQIRQVALRSGRRGFLDLVRQLGGEVEIEELPYDTANLTARFSQLKATRVAGARAERLLEQTPLLAMLATQTEGEFVIRDVQCLREGPEGDRLARLAGLLRQIEARVGEFPEGLVIQGGAPLRGGRLEVGGDPTTAMAFGVAGLLAESEIVLDGAEVLEGCYPEFCADLNALREKRR